MDRVRTSAELERIAAALNDLDSWLTLASEKQVRMQKSLRAVDRKIAATAGAIRQTEADISATAEALAALWERKQALLRERRTQVERIAEHLTAAHRLGGQDLIKQILNQQDPSELARMLRYHQYLSEARVTAVNAFEATARELDDNARALEQQTTTLNEQQSRLAREQQALAVDRNAARAVLDELDAERQSRTQEREQLVADRARLEALLGELRRRATELDGTAFASNKGQLDWPASSRVLKSYGSTRADGKLPWNGILLGAEAGTPVNAVAEGRVVFADWLRGYGLLLILDHGGGYMTLYGHAESLSKAVGDWVESGENIASAGRSGGQRRSGLYFEVRHNGETEDPIRWLAPTRG